MTAAPKGLHEPTFPILNKSNYQVWAMQMRLHLEGLEMWDVIESETAPRKKDRQAMSIMFSTISEELTRELDADKTAKQTWESLKTKNGGVSRLRKARFQSLKRYYETLFMEDNEMILDYFGKLSRIVVEMRGLGEKITNNEVGAKLLRSVAGKFDSITSSIEQFQDVNNLTLDGVLGSLKIHEDKLNDRSVKREEKALLARALGKLKKKDDDSSCGKGRGRGRNRGRGRGRSSHSKDDSEEEDEQKPQDKSKITCYNCQKLGHYSIECKFPKKNKPKKDKEKVNLIEEDKVKTTLLVATQETDNDILLQGIVQSELEEGLWYLDTGATSHMTGKKNLFYEFYESYKGNVRFGDDSRIIIEGRGKLLLNSKGDTQITLMNVLYTPKLNANIMSLGCLDEQGCQITLGKGILTIRDENGRLLTRIKRSSGRLYLLKLYTLENCLQVSEDATWKWHQRYGHLNFDYLISLSSENMVRGLPMMHKVDKLCHDCVHSKQIRSSFPSHSSDRAEKPLELIHADLCGPIEPETLGGSKYFLLIVDDCTRMMWTSMLRQKFDALEAFQRF